MEFRQLQDVGLGPKRPRRAPGMPQAVKPLTAEEEDECRIIDDTEQIYFIYEIGNALVARGYYAPNQLGSGDAATATSPFLLALAEWWEDYGENSLASVFRRVFCDGDKLREDLYRELKTSANHRDRAEIIAGWFGLSFQDFVTRETRGILEFLNRQGIVLDNTLSINTRILKVDGGAGNRQNDTAQCREAA